MMRGLCVLLGPAAAAAAATGMAVCTFPAYGALRETPLPVADDVLSFVPDAQERMTVPVSISGRGPFRFLVDTGAERTVISAELARQLGLGSGAKPTLHSMTEVREIRT